MADCTAHLEVDVPLSEHEQRLLEQIERALVDDDPKFASTVRTGDRRQKARRKLQLGVLLVVVGLAIVVAGVAIPSASVAQVVVGVLGFLIAFGGATLALLNYKGATGVVETGPVGGGRPGPGGSSRVGKARRQPMKNRLEERFRRRYDQ
ncbi:DUF3040 domain-containing protein [Modestobacter sp. VKM Ac-2986]|uniref:DUF3040 domain-containing protein n=1 Tax=Modestobacter sp. VKM Ac-2986 TaxID=3004140 RepID=UPI0022AABA78|nr:DUF3040 domain-containing protein [Modestobacter sp. VKM Ac-2986]MCZ2828304.1 DUF3040 domain-containing protein [Modestobacter sp. VKM Ac-2986]